MGRNLSTLFFQFFLILLNFIIIIIIMLHTTKLIMLRILRVIFMWQNVLNKKIIQLKCLKIFNNAILFRRTFNNIIIIIIIIIIVTCDLVDTRWQGSFFTYYIIYARTMKVEYLRVQVGRATRYLSEEINRLITCWLFSYSGLFF